jgi:hypothetical protein
VTFKDKDDLATGVMARNGQERGPAERDADALLNDRAIP